MHNTQQIERFVCGRIVLPGTVIDGGAVAIAGGRVSAVGAADSLIPGDTTVPIDDYGTALVFPGTIDGQTHACNVEGFPGIEACTRSAIAGGITCIVDMPYDEPEPVATADLVREKAATADQVAFCDVALWGTVLPDADIRVVAEMADAGIAAIKLSSFESHPVRFPRIPTNGLGAVLTAAKPHSLPVGLHNENQEIVRAALAEHRARGATSPSDHDASRPFAAEILATREFYELGLITGGHAHIVHLSTDDGYLMAADYREKGATTTAEMCIHYLWFDHDAVVRLGPDLKVNPPIRPGQRDKLWAAIANGLVTYISSDHGSWPHAVKEGKDMLSAPAGIPGMETLVPAFYTAATRRGGDPTLIAAHLAEKPAKFFGLWPDKGSLTPGAEADIMVVDPTPYTYDASVAKDGLCWSPFDGELFDGKVTATYLRGKPVFKA
ncbi:MAG: amidohydrolase family protein, partial [Pseudomonadota bacterium]